MKCTIGVDEVGRIEVLEVATKVSEKSAMAHDVPPDLLNALQRAQVALGHVEQAIVDHLISQGDWTYDHRRK